MNKKEILLSVLFLLLGAVLAASYFLFITLPAKDQVFKEQAETLNQKVNQLEKRLEQANKDLEALNSEIARLTTETPKAQQTEEEAGKKTSSSAVTKNIGLIKKAYTSGGKRYITIDYIQWLTGEEAVEAAREDGFITPDETSVPNDIYTRNVSKKLRTFRVSSSANIRILHPDGGAETYPATWPEFVSIVSPSRNPLCWIYINSSNVVTKIEQQYTP